MRVIMQLHEIPEVAIRSNLPVIGDVRSHFRLVLCVVPAAHHVERMLQISWIMRFHRGPHMGSRMAEFKLLGVQPLPFQSQCLTQLRIGTVHGVSRKRMSDGREMHADLMGSTGFQIHGNNVASPKRSITSQWVMLLCRRA